MVSPSEWNEFCGELKAEWDEKRMKVKPVPMPSLNSKLLGDISNIKALVPGRDLDFLVGKCLYEDTHKGNPDGRWGPGGGHAGTEKVEEYYCTQFVRNPWMPEKFWVDNYPLPEYSKYLGPAMLAVLRMSELCGMDTSGRLCDMWEPRLIYITTFHNVSEQQEFALAVCRAIVQTRLEFEEG